MGRVFLGGGKIGMQKPVGGIFLSFLAEGSIVKLNENGSPVEFYVAKHDYESGLNGTGRTLLVRKDCYDQRVWHSINSENNYATSDIDNWLNNTYKGLLDDNLQRVIDTTTFNYCPGYPDPIIETLNRSIFILSMSELGLSYETGDFGENKAVVDGSVLPISKILQIAYMNGSAVYQWTRTPWHNQPGIVFFVTKDGKATYAFCTNGPMYSRPCFTLPANALFDENTLEFKGVS